MWCKICRGKINEEILNYLTDYFLDYLRFALLSFVTFQNCDCFSRKKIVTSPKELDPHFLCSTNQNFHPSGFKSFETWELPTPTTGAVFHKKFGREKRKLTMPSKLYPAKFKTSIRSLDVAERGQSGRKCFSLKVKNHQFLTPKPPKIFGF